MTFENNTITLMEIIRFLMDRMPEYKQSWIDCGYVEVTEKILLTSGIISGGDTIITSQGMQYFEKIVENIFLKLHYPFKL